MSSSSMCELGSSVGASSCQSAEPVLKDSLESSGSHAAEVGIAAAVTFRRQARWLAENRNALDDSNTFVEQHGLPLAGYQGQALTLIGALACSQHVRHRG